MDVQRRITTKDGKSYDLALSLPDPRIAELLAAEGWEAVTRENSLLSKAKEVFEFWKETMGKNANVKLDQVRRRKIEGRLRDGYTVDQIKQAVLGCSWSPHNMGENSTGAKYNDIELICRDASKLDRFIDLGALKSITPSVNGRAVIRRLEPDENWEKEQTFADVVATHDLLAEDVYRDRVGYTKFRNSWAERRPQDAALIEEYERSVKFRQRFPAAGPSGDRATAQPGGSV
jgi:hypothetical protein